MRIGRLVRANRCTLCSRGNSRSIFHRGNENQNRLEKRNVDSTREKLGRGRDQIKVACQIYELLRNGLTVVK